MWEAGPRSVCLSCCGIGHERLEKCGNSPKKCVICAGEYHVNKHQCGVTGCGKRRGKLCIHVVARYANCNGNHQANSAQCPSRYKAEIQAHKKRRIGDDAPQAFESDVDNKANDRASTEPEETSPGLVNSDLDMEIDNEKEKSAQEPAENLCKRRSTSKLLAGLL